MGDAGQGYNFPNAQKDIGNRFIKKILCVCVCWPCITELNRAQ